MVPSNTDMSSASVVTACLVVYRAVVGFAMTLVVSKCIDPIPGMAGIVYAGIHTFLVVLLYGIFVKWLYVVSWDLRVELAPAAGICAAIAWLVYRHRRAQTVHPHT